MIVSTVSSPHLFGAANLMFVWNNASVEGQIIIFLLVILSIAAWSVMVAKAAQYRRARRLNEMFVEGFESQETVFSIYDQNPDVNGCPLYNIYESACDDLAAQVGRGQEDGVERPVTQRGIDHVQRRLERSVSEEALRLEAGLIVLAIAVSGSPFMGLLGTVWGVMAIFSDVAVSQQATLTVMAPGLSAAMLTTVAGLFVAIPSMFGYNWLLHEFRVRTVELDNFAQEMLSRIESEYAGDLHRPE